MGKNIFSAIAIGLLAASKPPLELGERVLYCSSLAIVAGCLAASRTSKRPATVIRTGLFTGCLAVCVAVGSEAFVQDNAAWNYGVISVCGLLGLGGMKSVDWVLSLFRHFAGKRIGDYERSDKSGDG